MQRKHLVPAIAGAVAGLTALACPQLFGGNSPWLKMLAVGTGVAIVVALSHLWPS